MGADPDRDREVSACRRGPASPLLARTFQCADNPSVRSTRSVSSSAPAWLATPLPSPVTFTRCDARIAFISEMPFAGGPAAVASAVSQGCRRIRASRPFLGCSRAAPKPHHLGGHQHAFPRHTRYVERSFASAATPRPEAGQSHLRGPGSMLAFPPVLRTRPCASGSAWPGPLRAGGHQTTATSTRFQYGFVGWTMRPSGR